MQPEHPQLVIVGSVGIDTIETPQDRRDHVLGGSATYACAAASYFARVGMVGIVGNDYEQELRTGLSPFQIDLDGLQIEAGQTFHWSGRYHENMDDRDTLLTELGVFEHFSPELPARYRQTPFLFLGNIGPELQLQVLEQIDDPKFTMVDTMDLWINIARDPLEAVIRRVDLLTLNESEARLFTGRDNLLNAAHELLDLGPQFVLIKKGASGSMLISRGGGIFLMPAYPLKHVTDPTGAGDSFAGGLIGSLAQRGTLNEEGLRRAMLHGAVVASFGVESFSLERFSDLHPEEITARANVLREMTRIPSA